MDAQVKLIGRVENQVREMEPLDNLSKLRVTLVK